MNIDFTAIAPLIEQMAAKLGVASEHLWGVLVRQAVAEGIISLFMGVVFLFITYICVKALMWYNKKEEEYMLLRNKRYLANRSGEEFKELDIEFETMKDRRGEKQAIAIICSLLGILFFSIGISELWGGGLRLLNPEYYAFIDIVKQFK
jgi:hypothetical protein